MIKREVYLLKHLKHPRIMKMLQYFQSDNYVFIVTEYIPNGTLLQLIENYTRQQMKFTEKVFWQHNVLRKFRQLNIIQSFRKFWIIFATFCWHWNTYNLEVLFMVTWKVKTFWLVVMVGLKLAILVFPNVWTIRSSRMRYVSQKFWKIERKRRKLPCCYSTGHSTPLYTAPEALFDKTKYTFASDIWSLGCIFYELCMLRHPFHRVNDINELYELSSRSIYQTIDYQRKNYSRDLLTLSDLMLEPKVEKRATIEKIIPHRAIMTKYYEKYFDMGDL